MDQKDYRTGFLQLQGLRGCATKPVWGVFTEDPVMRKALLCHVLDVSGCDLKPGTVLGLGGPARMVHTATINKWPWVFTSKSLTHHTQTALGGGVGSVLSGPCSGNSPF